MRVRQKDINTFEFERESWKEFFRFFVSMEAQRYIESRYFAVPIPKGYKLYKGYMGPKDYVYWRWQFLPLVRVCDAISRSYWLIARWFRLRGMLDKKEGEAYQKFWFLHLHLPR